MKAELQSYLAANRVGVLGVNLSDGTPHTAAVHYSQRDEPFCIYVQTGSDSVKCSPFATTEKVLASLTVGTSEVEWKTMQVHGFLEMVKDTDEVADFKQVHYAKNPDAASHDGPDTAYLRFTPTWWRFSDYQKHPVLIIEETNDSLQ